MIGYGVSGVFFGFFFFFLMALCLWWLAGAQDSDDKQCHISFHLHLVDGAQLLHAVFVIKLVLPIHGNSEVLRVAADDHLWGDDSRFKNN